MELDRLAVIIPTYNPSNKLEILLKEIKKRGFKNIIIVNDGSIDDGVLYKIKVDKILGHSFNMGKGKALKTGFEYVDRLDVDGVITIDDDLQHAPSDIVKMSELFLKENGIYFGIRKFDKAPIIRKLANQISASIFNKIYSCNIEDTQCGLRIFPKSIIYKLINIKGERFEYEINQLKYLVMNGYDIKKVQIETLYNGKSHFNGLADSFKIIKNMFDKEV